jgi:hypothetical protein
MRHTSDAPEASGERKLPQLDLPAQQAPDLALCILHSRLDILLHHADLFSTQAMRVLKAHQQSQ